MNNPLSITELANLIKKHLPKEKILLKGEVSQPKDSRGNMYLTLKDNNPSMMKSIIWKNKLDLFKSKINEGDEITVDGNLDFYGGYGTLSFIVNQLVKHEGEGEINALFLKIKEQFEKKGYFDDKHKQEKPLYIKKVLILTRDTGSVINDFNHNIEENNSKLQHDLIDVSVQGNNCPSDVIDVLENDDGEVDFSKYDMIVVIRGGGSKEELFGFSKPELIEAVFKFKEKPILSAIGHKPDVSLLDLVADFSAPTPSLAAQFIIDTNKNFILNMEDKKEEVKKLLIQDFNVYMRTLNKLNENIIRYFYSFDEIKKNIFNNIVNFLNRKILILSKIESSIELKINTLQIQMKMNDKNYVLAYGNKKCSNLITNSNKMEEILSKNEIYLSVLEDPNSNEGKRKIFKITNFNYDIV